MNRFFYFKVTFLSVFAGLFVGTLVYNSFAVEFSNNDAIGKMVLKSFVTSLIIALLAGLFNMYLKIGNFKQKEN